VCEPGATPQEPIARLQPALKARLNPMDALGDSKGMVFHVNRAFSAVGSFCSMGPGALPQADSESRAVGAKLIDAPLVPFVFLRNQQSGIYNLEYKNGSDSIVA
jgi:hypothetical protein